MSPSITEFPQDIFFEVATYLDVADLLSLLSVSHLTLIDGVRPKIHSLDVPRHPRNPISKVRLAQCSYPIKRSPKSPSPRY